MAASPKKARAPIPGLRALVADFKKTVRAKHPRERWEPLRKAFATEVRTMTFGPVTGAGRKATGTTTTRRAAAGAAGGRATAASRKATATTKRAAGTTKRATSATKRAAGATKRANGTKQATKRMAPPKQATSRQAEAGRKGGATRAKQLKPKGKTSPARARKAPAPAPMASGEVSQETMAH